MSITSHEHYTLPHDHGGDISKVLSVMPGAESFGKAAEAFGLLGDTTRLRILWLICHSEQCVQNIAAAVGMSPPAVSHHLKILKSAGLIVNKRLGREMHYALSDTIEGELLHRIVDEMLAIKCPSD